MPEALRFQRLSRLSDHLCYRCQPLAVPGVAGARPLSLYLPPNYFKEAEKPWPVAVFFDGHNLFDDVDTLAGGWHLHEALASRHMKGLTVPVVIGIHPGTERDSELSPWPLFTGKPGHAIALMQWFHHTILPRLKKQLLLHTENMLVGGSSLGALLALYTVLEEPRRYDKALMMSPALWPDSFRIFEYVMGHSQLTGKRLYFDHGQKEDHPELGDILFQQTGVMADTFALLGLKREQELFWRPDPLGEHNEASWARRLPKALSLIYGDPPTEQAHV